MDLARVQQTSQSCVLLWTQSLVRRIISCLLCRLSVCVFVECCICAYCFEQQSFSQQIHLLFYHLLITSIELSLNENDYRQGDHSNHRLKMCNYKICLGSCLIQKKYQVSYCFLSFYMKFFSRLLQSSVCLALNS